MDRELKAVYSEMCSYLQNDGWRLFQASFAAANLTERVMFIRKRNLASSDTLFNVTGVSYDEARQGVVSGVVEPCGGANSYRSSCTPYGAVSHSFISSCW